MPDSDGFADKSAFPFDTTRREGRWSTDFPVPSQRRPFAADDSLRTLAVTAPPRSSWVLRPALIVRVLWAGLILLLAILTMFAGLLAHMVAGVAEEVRAYELAEPLAVIEEPLPSATQLKDPERFADLLAERPERRTELLLARLQALIAAADPESAHAVFVQLLASEHQRRLTAEQQLALAGAAAQLRRFDVVRRLLSDQAMRSWPLEQRNRGVALLGRVLAAAEQQAHRRSTTPPGDNASQ